MTPTTHPHLPLEWDLLAAHLERAFRPTARRDLLVVQLTLDDQRFCEHHQRITLLDEHEDGQELHDEEDSFLPDLPMSPARFAFTNQFAKPDPESQDSISSVFRSDPFSDGAVLEPLSTPRTSAPHTRNQSIGEPRVHARNLSLFFPQPGAEVLRAPASPRSGELEAPVTDISGNGRRKVGLGANGSFSFGSGNQVMQAPSSPVPKVVGRRGHHVSTDSFVLKNLPSSTRNPPRN
jgi:hypothetical protein